MDFSFIFAPIIMIFSAFGGSGQELLDVVDSKSYWKLAGIEQSAESMIPLVEQKSEEPEHESQRYVKEPQDHSKHSSGNE